MFLIWRGRNGVFAAALITLAIGLCSASPSPPPSEVVTAVLTPEGARIKGAMVLFHVDKAGEIPPSDRTDVTGTTGPDGLAGAKLRPGFYDVFVTGEGFSPQCRKIFVEAVKPMRLTFHLGADPLVMQRLGDVFR